MNKSIDVLTEYASLNGYTIVDMETHAKELFDLIKKTAEEQSKK